MLFLEVLLFHPRLNLRRREVPEDEDGVVGSSGLEIRVGVSVLGAFPSF